VAKDIAQESWIIIMSKIHTLENVDSFRSWAYRIIYTKAIDSVKNRMKARIISESGSNIESGVLPSEDESKRIRVALLEAIQKLPKEKQDIIRLFYTEQYSIREISIFLEIPVGTVKTRLFNAREKLKSKLKNIHHEK